MEQIETAYPAGTLIQDQYVVEGLLGRGGFSAVYVVKSQDTRAQRFALKELRTQSKDERARLLFECEVLSRLDHPALPTVDSIFDDNERTYMLMQYIAGENLETLRRQQPEQRFALSTVLALLAPVVDAVGYLHRQAAPILHRDIKPANIIVAKGRGKTVLVDFGIAKEYYPDATTTAVRHCSPGYGAPEQYSGVGTDQRTDIYGLGATCYVLLTGAVPVDALQRATSLATKRVDPLVPANERVEAIPATVAHVLQRAMAIGNEQRFATVEEFWLALVNAAQPGARDTSGQLRAGQRPGVRQEKSTETLPPRRVPRITGVRLIALQLLVLLMLAAGGLTASFFVARQHEPKSMVVVSQPHTTTSAPKTPSLVTSILAHRYAGTVNDLLTSTKGSMTLSSVQQNGAVISGSFAGLQRTGAFSGVLDTSKHILFTVAAHAGQASLFFEGSQRVDGNLVGNYCHQDASGQCIGDYGIWSVAPVA
jgi:eukaryotic-like serine/threonine-protein kinase